VSTLQDRYKYHHGYIQNADGAATMVLAELLQALLAHLTGTDTSAPETTTPATTERTGTGEIGVTVDGESQIVEVPVRFTWKPKVHVQNT
jgi:hypothetical protein